MENSDTKTQFEARDDQGATIKHSKRAGVIKQRLLKLLAVKTIMVRTRVKGLLKLGTDHSLANQGYLPAKDVVEVLLMIYSFFSSIKPL